MEEIGGGGVAVVYRGRWGDKTVAVKTLFDPKVNDALRAEYLDELHVMSGLSHPNIVSLLGACMTPPKLFFVMELCERSLFRALHENRQHPLSREGRTRVAKNIADGMAYLHARPAPIVHRDLKSANVLEQRGEFKICDFGLVRTKNAGAGTPSYIAPEIFRGQSFSLSVDTYAFGVLLNEIFSNEIPFREYDYDDVKRSVTRGDRPPLPRYSDTPDDTIRKLIVDCWADDAAARPTFAAVAEILEAAVASPLATSRSQTSFCDAEHDVGGDCLDSLMSGL